MSLWGTSCVVFTLLQYVLYPTSEIQVITPRGRFTLQVGVVEQLPVPVLFGRDSPLFSRYWPAEAMDPKRRARKRPVKIGKSSVARPAWAAVSPDGSPAETTNDDRDKPSLTQNQQLTGLSLCVPLSSVLCSCHRGCGMLLDETPLFEPSLLKELDWSCNTVSFSPPISPCSPGEGLVLRPLCMADFNRGFYEVLSQLTQTGDVTPEQFTKKFEHMKKTGDYFVIVVEDTNLGQIVATATLITEHKFIHSCAKRGRVEEVVVSDVCRGKQLGKLLVSTLTLLSKKLDCYKITLECAPKNVAFYQKFGYGASEETYMQSRFHDWGQQQLWELFGSEYPITFVSRKLLPHEKNYATIEKECLAVKWAIEKLKYHLLGREFTLVTDHAPLKWMAFNKDKNARITRWFLHLQDFKFTVELGGGVCDGPAGEQCPTWLSTAKRREARGMVFDGRYYPRGSHRELLPSQVSLIVPHRWSESTRQSGAFLTSTRGYGGETVAVSTTAHLCTSRTYFECLVRLHCQTQQN